MDSLPTGTVTFLFTDIEGSASLYQKFPDAMPDVLAQHHGLLRDAICAAFENAEWRVAPVT